MTPVGAPDDAAVATGRRDALAAWRAAVAAVAPAACLRHRVGRRGEALWLGGEPLPSTSGRRVLVALGKAAPGLAAGWLETAPGWADELFVLAPHGVPTPAALAGVTVHRGGHPGSDAAGAAATAALLKLAAGLGRDDQLVVLLSGGASALLATPAAGLTLAAVVEATHALAAGGAPITDLNTLRRELLAAGGGGLARAAAPASVATLVLSDVVAGTPADVASGPTVASPTGPGDALEVLRRYRLAATLPEVVAWLTRRTTAPPAPPPPGRLVPLGDNRDLVAAAARHLAAAGYRTRALARPLLGDAARAGRRLGALAAAVRGDAAAVVLGGETTVTVRGAGRGGRCQELALAAAPALAGGRAVLLAAGSDGVDGASGNAGAVVDGGTVGRLAAAGVDPDRALAANDSSTALQASGDAIAGGPTGTNVADLVVILKAPPALPVKSKG